jgi:hypothetical protein
VFLGTGAGQKNITGFSNVIIGVDANLNSSGLQNAIAIGYKAIVEDNNSIKLGNDDIAVLKCKVDITVTSDSTKKENFKLVNGEEVLSKISKFRLTSWNFKGQSPRKFRHYGPMAQDFYNAFGNDGIGEIGNSTTINKGDLSGISLVAIQALEKRTAELQKKLDLRDKEVDLLKADNENLHKDNLDLHKELTEIKELLKGDQSISYSSK